MIIIIIVIIVIITIIIIIIVMLILANRAPCWATAGSSQRAPGLAMRATDARKGHVYQK